LQQFQMPLTFGLVDVLEAPPLERAVEGGVVDQHVDAAKGLLGGVGHGQRAGPVGGVEVDAEGLAALALDGGHGLGAIAHVGDHHGRTLARQRPGVLLSQAPRRAGDDGDFSF
jgi:hypothetical protein